MISSAFQQPIVQNRNRYVDGSFTGDQLGAVYIQTKNYKRSGDVLLRLSYFHKPKKSLKYFSFVYSLLPIYHLQNDKHEDSVNNRIEIDNSKGLTLNINLFAKYTINPNTMLEISTGFPIISRQVRPDGMSQFALTFEVIKQF